MLRLMILTVVAAGLVWATAATATPACSPELKHRTPQQVLADHWAALAAQDWDAARCNFAAEAVMISDNGVSQGVEAIIAEFQSLDTFFGGFFNQVYQEIMSRS